MVNLESLEKGVGSKTTKSSVGRIAAALLILGVGLVGFGVYFLSSRALISASTEQQPPVPDNPTRQTQQTPPVPDVPTRGSELPPVPSGPNEFTFAAGWSMISGEALYGYDLGEFRNAGLSLYSFNDPKYANRDWAIIYGSTSECQKEKIGCNVIVPQPPLGYYVYNPKSQSVKVTLKPTTTPDLSTNVFGRGWHILYWGGNPVDKKSLLDSITFTYSDGKVLTGTQAITSDEHKVSMKIYGVVDETTIDLAKALKELGSKDDATTISKIPKNSYFWVYLRRTSKRVTAISVNSK